MILASQSPRRLQILQEAGFDPVVIPADINETRYPDEDPMDLVARLCQLKAYTVQEQLAESPEDGLLLAADTVVYLNSTQSLGKPTSPAEAESMLHLLSGRTHYVSTGVTLLLLDSDASILDEVRFVESTEVEFYDLTSEEIAAYVASGEPLDKAGAYGIQGKGRMLVRGIVGDYENVVGLPIARVVREIAKLTKQHDLLASILERNERN